MTTRRCRLICLLCLLACVASGCVEIVPGVGDSAIETSFAFTNFSMAQYAQLSIRRTGDDAFVTTPLLPPGATHRERFLDALGVGCPGQIDLRVALFERINDEVPIGLDDGEAVGEVPSAGGEFLNLPACGSVVVETLTIVNWDAPVGEGVVKIGQGTPLERVLRQLPDFDNRDGVWTFEGVDDALGDVMPEPRASAAQINGRVITADGTGLSDVGVLLRTRFRVRLNDEDPSNDPDAGFSAPIALTATDANGAFSFDRPAGGYRVEVFSDALLFRPAIIDVESPIDELVIIAEPLP